MRKQSRGARTLRRALRAALVACAALAGAALVAACGSSSDASSGASGGGGSGASNDVDVVLLAGAQQFPIEVMQSQGLDKKYDLNLKVADVPTSDAMYTRIQANSFDVAFGAWTSIANFRAREIPATTAYSFQAFPNDIIVAEDSPLHDFGDLKGKKLGLFGGPAAGTTVLLQAELKKWYGVDMRDVQVQYAAGALLSGQLEKGQLDATMVSEPLATEMLASGRYRSIGNIGDVWSDHTGQTPMNQGVTMNSDWASANPDVARRFDEAFSEALTYLTDHPDAWGPLARSMGLRTAAEADLLRRRVVKELINRWDPAFIDQQRAFYSQLLGIVGPVPGMPARLPDGTFNLDYVRGGGS